ncbi:hypothetical protein HYV88_06330 [Candidatus Woesearchaeota archaeon]|nr:hypothetical protein [Candidatus Woesearchaeota archaeon]
MVKFTNFQNKISLVLIIIILLSSFGFAQGIPRNPGHPVSQLDCGTGTTSDPYKACDSNNNGILDTTENAVVTYALNLTPSGTGPDVALKTKFVDSSRLSVPTDVSNNYLVAFSGTGGAAQHIKVGYSNVAGSLDPAAAVDVMFKSVYDRINSGDGIVDTAEMLLNESGGFGIVRLVPSITTFNGLSDFYVTQKIVEPPITPTGNPVVTLKKLRAGYADEALKSSGSFTVTGPYLIFNVPDTGSKYATRLISIVGDRNNIALAPGAAWDDTQGSVNGRGNRECVDPSNLNTCAEQLIGARLVINPEGHFDKGVQIGWPDRSLSSNNQNAWIDHTNKAGDLYVAGNLEVDGSTYLGDAVTDTLTVTGSFSQTGNVNIGGSLKIGDGPIKKVDFSSNTGEQDIFVTNDIETGNNLWVGTKAITGTPDLSAINKKIVVYNIEPTYSTTLGMANSGIELINANSISGGAAGEDSQVDIGFSNGLTPLGRYAAITGVVTGTGPVGSLIFSTRGANSNDLTERMRIISDGKIGIGDFSSSAPSANLDVQGDTKISKNLDVGTDAFINGKLCIGALTSGQPADSNCKTSWDSVGNIRGSGNQGSLAMFESIDSIISSSITQTGTGATNDPYVINIVGNLGVTGTILSGNLPLAKVGVPVPDVTDDTNYVVNADGSKKLRAGYADISSEAIESFLISKKSDANSPSPELKFKVNEVSSGGSQLVDNSAIYAENIILVTQPPSGRLIINNGGGFPGGVQIVGNLDVTGNLIGGGSGVGGGWTVDTITSPPKTTTNLNVGIGTNNPSTGATLTLGNDADSSSEPLNFHIGGAQVIADNAYYTGTSSGWKYNKNSFASYIAFADGIEIATAPSGTADATVTWNKAVKIDSSGNILVGTPLLGSVDPNYKLQVFGDTSLGDVNAGSGVQNVVKINSIIQFRSTTMNNPCTPGQVYYNTNNGLQVCDGAGWQDIATGSGFIDGSGNPTPNTIAMFTPDGNTIGNSNIKQDATTGNIGIGVTGTPGAKLDVGGNIKMSGFQLTTGASVGKVLTSMDNSGVGTWQSISSSESDTLQSVTGRGATTTRSITVGSSDIVNGLSYGLALNKYFTLWGSDENEAYISHNVYYNAGWKYREGTIGAGATLINVGGGIFNVRTAGDGLQNQLVTWNQGIYQGENGNVGIGTSAPGGFRLNVEGPVYSSDFIRAANGVWVGGATAKRVIDDLGNWVGNPISTSGVTQIKNGGGLSVNPASGTGDVTLAIKPEGFLEINTATSAVRLKSCPDTKILKYTTANGWVCADDAGGATYTAGDGINIASNVISVSGTGNVFNNWDKNVADDLDAPAAGCGVNQVLTYSAIGGLICTTDNTGTSYWTQSVSNIYYDSGNVGIGTSNPNDGKLILNALTGPVVLKLRYGDEEKGAIFYSDAATETNRFHIRAGKSGSGIGKLALDTGGSNTPRLLIDEAGNVGIGTATPIAKLEVTTTSGNSVIKINSNNAISAIDFYNGDSNNEWGIGKDVQNNFYIDEFGVGNRLLIKPGGNVVIGGAPSTGYKLEVSGAVKATDFVANGFIQAANFRGEGSELTNVKASNLGNPLARTEILTFDGVGGIGNHFIRTGIDDPSTTSVEENIALGFKKDSSDVTVIGNLKVNGDIPVPTPGTLCGWSSKIKQSGESAILCNTIDPLSNCPTGYTRKALFSDTAGSAASTVWTCIKLP